MEIEEHGIELGAGCTCLAMVLLLFSRWDNPTKNSATILGVDLISVIAVVVIMNGLTLLIWHKTS